jgi:hypothetical protein
MKSLVGGGTTGQSGTSPTLVTSGARWPICLSAQARLSVKRRWADVAQKSAVPGVATRLRCKTVCSLPVTNKYYIIRMAKCCIVTDKQFWVAPNPAQAFDDFVPLLGYKRRAVQCDCCHKSLTRTNLVLSYGEYPACGICGTLLTSQETLLEPDAEWYLEEGLPIKT